jgi:hypothetical protein
MVRVNRRTVQEIAGPVSVIGARVTKLVDDPAVINPRPIAIRDPELPE